MAYIRAFFAIKIPEEIKDSFSRFTIELENISDSFRIVKKERLHITLAFLGETKEKIIRLLLERLIVEKDVYKTELLFNQTGCFGPPNRPRVVWIGSNPSRQLSQLRDKLVIKSKECGIHPDEKEFKCHVTVARNKMKIDKPSLENLLDKYGGYKFGKFTINTITLFQSELKPDGPVYSAIKEFSL